MYYLTIYDVRFMRYTKALFDFRFTEEWQADVFVQELFDLGFDTLDNEEAYIQTELLDEAALRTLVDDTEGVTLLAVEDCPDLNWNATWEAEHPVEELPLGVTIVPHCAFGNGHHETTGMMIEALMATDLTGKCVLDNGCGTGVLGIMALKSGAQQVYAVDIDDKSVESTRENAARNHVEIEAHLGATPLPGHYDLILSNIHRNILLAQMAQYSAYLNPGGEVWLSGFLEEDCAPLIEAARAHGLQHLHTTARGEWRMIRLCKG